MPQRYFTLEEANQLLLWLQAAFSRIQEVQHQIQETHRELERLRRHGRRNGASDLNQNLREQQGRVQRLSRQEEEDTQAILAKGILLRDPHRGLVDFPALREGREIYLCWLLGEEEIQTWHEVDAGFAGRQPL